MKKLPALTAALLFGLGGICNQAQTKFDAQLTPNEQELYSDQKSQAYLRELKDELSTINKLNNKKLTPQNMFFLWYYTQKISELEVLLAKQNATFSVATLQRLQIAIQIKTEEIELLKSQAHHNINGTNIFGL